MDLTHANVLITGGSDGIGLGLAARFLAAGSNVMITGRNAHKLDKVAKMHVGLKVYANDISIAGQRLALAKHVNENMPGLNILINNAGIQRRVSLASDEAPWSESQAEIDTLLSAPVHLNHLLIPLILSHKKESLIINVTSGGAYVPQVFAPLYSACKAALHSYTMTLRHALSNTDCHVIELIPPAVQTSLTAQNVAHGVQLDEFCDEIFPMLVKEEITEIGFGITKGLVVELSGTTVEERFKQSITRFPVDVY